jgi:broad specificity phosphatase PhoE
LTKFYLIRHAEPDWSVADVKGLRGLQIEFCPLSREGIKQAMCIATNPNLRNAEVVISSPYTRALQIAAIISRELSLPLIVEYDLHEWVPDFRLRYTKDEIFNTIVKDFKKYSGEPPKGERKNWETMSSVRHRVRKILEKYRKHAEVIAVCLEL